MEEININSNDRQDVDQATWSITNFVSHEETVDTQPNSEDSRDINNYFSDFDGSNILEEDKMEEKSTALANSDVVILNNNEEDSKKIKQEIIGEEQKNKVTERGSEASDNNQGSLRPTAPGQLVSIMQFFPTDKLEKKVNQEIANIPKPVARVDPNQNYSGNIPYQQNTVVNRSASPPSSPIQKANRLVMVQNPELIKILNSGKIVTKCDGETENETMTYNTVSNYNRRVGLWNHGSMCYINSIMQVLLATNKLSEFAVIRMCNVPYWRNLAELFTKMMYTSNSMLYPKRYYVPLNTKEFNIFQEHDAAEFLLYLLDLLKQHEPRWESAMEPFADEPRPSTSAQPNDEPVAGSSSDDNPQDQATRETWPTRVNIAGLDEMRKYFINNLFGSVLATRVKCLTCKTLNQPNCEFIYMLHLSLPETTEDEVHTVQNLINFYFALETLEGLNQYMCNACGNKRDAVRNSVYTQTPRYLVLCLKIFKYLPASQQLIKKNVRLYINNDIHVLSVEKNKEKSTYKLYGVIVHVGQSLYTGHYISLIKANEQWYKLNDSVVTCINEDSINDLGPKDTPYMLFFRRSDISESEFPSFEEIKFLRDYVQKQGQMKEHP